METASSPKRGRPAKAPGCRREDSIRVPLTPAENDFLRQTAADQDRSVAAVVRQALAQAGLLGGGQ